VEQTPEHPGRQENLSLAALLAIGLLVYLLGVGHDLPYVVQGDEVGYFAAPAARIAATGNLHPGWFGHPASTTIYPLSAVYRIWHASAHGGAWFSPDPRLIQTFEGRIGAALLLGRLLSVAYGAGALWATYRLGRRIVRGPGPLIAVALLIPVPHLILFAQMVRSDTATVFFAALGLWAIVRVLEEPSLAHQVAAGLACGVAISTKYYLGLLVAALLLADLIVLGRSRQRGELCPRVLATLLAGLAAVAVGFAVTTPFFLLDLPTAWRDLTGELRPAHLGADGLSAPQNLWWYLTVALPSVWGWGRYALALAGGAWLAARGNAAARLLLAFALLYLLGISASPLHWERWVFPILPVLALCAATAISRGVLWLRSRAHLPPRVPALLAALAVLGVCILPLWETIVLEIRQMRPSTMVLTRRWIDMQLPPGTVIAREEYSFPVNGSNLRLVGKYVLGERPLDYYLDRGADYIAVSSAIYERFYREPERYPEQIAFYEELDRSGDLVYQVVPDRWTSGPTVKVYRVAAER
jgi:hypothetical protein